MSYDHAGHPLPKPNDESLLPPPYSYTVVAPVHTPVPSPMHLPTPGPMHIPSSMPISPVPRSPYPQVPYQHYSFGPTPISAQPTTSYPYYDARSPHSIQQAGIRARQRFFEALFWAMVTWCMIGFLIGSSAVHIVNSLH